GVAQAGRAPGEEEAEALVGLPGGAEAGELAHGPQAAAVHRGVDAAGEGVLSRVAEVGFGVEAVEAVGRVQGVDGYAADRGGRLRTRRGGGVLLLPALAGSGV